MDAREKAAALLFLSFIAACDHDNPIPPTPAFSSPPPSAQSSTPAPVVSPGASLPPSASAPPSASGPAAPLNKCPDLANPDRVAAFDWVAELDAPAALGPDLMGVAGTATETKALAGEIEAELRAACASLATQLGGKGPLTSADTACQAAVDALRTTRQKLGPGTKITVNTHAPVCAAAEDAMNECADRCAPSVKHTSACDSGATLGRCAETCDGTCELKTAATCDGTCEGKCASGFTGTCGGICKGKCGGKELKEGFCGAKCEGTCEGVSKGSCKGACDGACAGKVTACTGQCEGKCSGTMQEPKCATFPKVDGLTNDCSSYCRTRVVRKAMCTEAVVSVTIKDAKDPIAKAAYEQNVERLLPLVLKVQRRLKGRVDAISKNQDAVSEGLKTISSGGGAALPKLNPCLFGVEKTVTESVATLLADAKAADLVVTTAEAK